MKIRVISAVVSLIIIIPLIIKGGTLYTLGVFVLSAIALREFINMKETKKTIPLFLKIISYVFLTMIILLNGSREIEFLIDYRVITGLFLVYLIPIVMYHDNNKYSITDAFYLIGGLFFLGLSFDLLVVIRNIDIHLLIYLILITTMTDTFAYITGYLIGKNKLLEAISPKKTWEGLIGGTIMGVFIASVFYISIVNPKIDLFVLVFITLFLSIIAQLGDLVFSSIKRYFGKKDFSNLMPGHGGILDRMDSIIFAAFGFMFFITFL